MSELKIDNFQKSINLALLEEQIIAYWDAHDIFKKSISQRPVDKPYVFYDGPPFATGLPHYGHILASTTKDVIPRYHTMKGYRVERQWGWDCHGLPIENIVEKDLNLKDKLAIEQYGIGNFNEACRSMVLRYADEWKKVIHRLGRWVDMEHDYKTMEPWYMESLWWVFKQLWDRKLIYQGHKAMHICPRCGTPLSNFEVTQGYKDVKDISVFVEFEVTNAAVKLDIKESVRLIAWTTTPWTLPGNVLLAVKPDATYVIFSGKEPEKLYIAAKDRLSAFTEKVEIKKEILGVDLVGLTYTPIFPYYKATENAFRVVEASFVTMEDGSGIVHIAPAFGEDDYAVGKEQNIPLVQHVGMDGKFKKEVTDFSGLSVKPKDNPLETDILILKYLVSHDALFLKQNITHSYPHCWRCETPLINYATASWFVDVTSFKDELLSNNQNINWLPVHIKNGRFGKWLENVRDWAISRNRFWGTPLPVWQNEEGEMICVGSIKELEDLSGVKVTDLHKHIVDEITFKKDGKTFRRTPEVLDCWFESGAMPYASFHYPFENKEKFEQSFPAEFISEGQDQTRGWFYTLHVLATALTLGDHPAIPVKKTTSSFKNVIVSGIVLAEDGKKMSKSLKNYPDPMLVGEKYSIDALRFYLMNSPVVRAENLNFSEKGVDEIRRKVLNIIWNVFSFYKLYDQGNSTYGFPEKAVHVLDVWLISKIETLIKEYTKAMDSYDVVNATRLLMEFTDIFSTWWLRQSRDRIKNAGSNDEVLVVFRTALLRWSLVAAPIIPFVSELMYQNLTGMTKESIHLEYLPTPNEKLIDQKLESDMVFARQIVEKVHAQRKEKGFNLRQPLSKFTATGPDVSLSTALQDLICQETNVKSMEFLPGEELVVMLDTHITDELKIEGESRELIRKIQDARKASGTDVDEWVEVILPTWPKAFESEIMSKVKATKLIRGEGIKIARLIK
jgi:isoleucyl-tRNA synthetase